NCFYGGCIGDLTVDYGNGNAYTFPSNIDITAVAFYTEEGTYTVSYCWQNLCDSQTICDSFTIDVIDCDTCKPEIDFYQFCYGSPTIFNFNFDRYCAESDSIAVVEIHYGDGYIEYNTAGNPFSFSHTYFAIGTYTIIYSWLDYNGLTKTDTVVITIEDCVCPPTYR